MNGRLVAESTRLFVALLSAVAFLPATRSHSDEPAKGTNLAAGSMLGNDAGDVRDDNGLKMKLAWCPPGFVTMEQVEAGDSANLRPDQEATALVAFVRTIGLKREDVQRLIVTRPDGETFVDQTEKPLERDKAQYLLFAGKKRPAEGWKPGSYRATYSVTRDGKVLLQRTFEVSL